MKITAFNGSPKGETGNTHVMVDAFLKGAESAGADVENIFLVDKQIKHCTGCVYCLMVRDGKCIIKDDMVGLIATLIASDIVVIATPLYFESVSSILKVFIDRTYCLGEHVPPKIVAIANAGRPYRSVFDTLSRTMKLFTRDSELIAEIYTVEGPLLTADVPQFEPIINQYKQLLHQAGQEIVVHLALSEETQQALEKSFIPAEDYLQMLNEAEEQLKSENE